MCKRGLVERQSGASRAMYAVITAAGRTALKSAAPSHAQEVRRLVIDHLTAVQIDHLAEISNAILDHLHTDPPAIGS
jgi:DNA-binding MarR family transcriptional regulator